MLRIDAPRRARISYYYHDSTYENVLVVASLASAFYSVVWALSWANGGSDWNFDWHLIALAVFSVMLIAPTVISNMILKSHVVDSFFRQPKDATEIYNSLLPMYQSVAKPLVLNIYKFDSYDEVIKRMDVLYAIQKESDKERRTYESPSDSDIVSAKMFIEDIKTLTPISGSIEKSV